MSNLLRLFRIGLLVKSFAFGLLVAVLWMRSFGIADRLSVDMGKQSCSLTSVAGVCVYHAVATGSDQLSLASTKHHFERLEAAAVIKATPGLDEAADGSGFSYRRSSIEGGRGLDFMLTVPHWLIFLLVSVRAIIWSVRRILGNGVPVNANGAKRELGWCGRCQCNQYGVLRRCVRCGSEIAMEYSPVPQAR